MSRNKVENPKTARTSLCFKEKELSNWKQYSKDNSYKSFSEFVRQAIEFYIKEKSVKV